MAKGGHTSRSQEARIRFWMWLIFAALMLPFVIVEGWQEYADRRWGEQARRWAVSDGSDVIARKMVAMIGLPLDQAEKRVLATCPQVDTVFSRLLGTNSGSVGRTFVDRKTGNRFRFLCTNGLVDAVGIESAPTPPGARPGHYHFVERLRQGLVSKGLVCWAVLYFVYICLACISEKRLGAGFRRLVSDLLCATILTVVIAWILDPDHLGWYAIVDFHRNEWIVLPAIAATIIVALVTYRRKKPPPIGVCPTCGYNLTGNVSGICPECGTPVPEELRETLAVAARQSEV